MNTRTRTSEQVISAADGTPIAVWRSGAGSGSGARPRRHSRHGRWAPVLPALEKRFTVLALDRRGRGESGDAGRVRSSEREFEDVAAVVDWAGTGV